MKTAKRLRRHACQRALEREGIQVGKHSLHAAVRDIQNARGKFVRRRSLRVTEWLVDILGSERRVLYDKERKEIITFLPQKPTTNSSDS